MLDNERKVLCSDDDEFEDLYNDPSLDALYANYVRSDEKEWRKKELSRKTKLLKR